MIIFLLHIQHNIIISAKLMKLMRGGENIKKQIGVFLLVFVAVIGLTGTVSAVDINSAYEHHSNKELSEKLYNNQHIGTKHVVNAESNSGSAKNTVYAPVYVYAPIINSPGAVFKPIINSPSATMAGGNVDSGANGDTGDTTTTGGIKIG